MKPAVITGHEIMAAFRDVHHASTRADLRNRARKLLGACCVPRRGNFLSSRARNRHRTSREPYGTISATKTDSSPYQS